LVGSVFTLTLTLSLRERGPQIPQGATYQNRHSFKNMGVTEYAESNQ